NEKQIITTSQSWLLILIQAFATSIDALSIGLTFAVMDVNIYFSATIIGFVTFGTCFCTYLLADKLEKKIGNKGGFYGGILLILVAIKAVIEHGK
ncbi:MAG: manganese efflux pump, partial [Oscillospiraceae bacterium]